MISVTIALSEKQPCKLASYDKHGLLRAYFIPSPRKILASFDNKNNVMIYAHLLRWNKVKNVMNSSKDVKNDSPLKKLFYVKIYINLIRLSQYRNWSTDLLI